MKCSGRRLGKLHLLGRATSYLTTPLLYLALFQELSLDTNASRIHVIFLEKAGGNRDQPGRSSPQNCWTMLLGLAALALHTGLGSLSILAFLSGLQSEGYQRGAFCACSDFIIHSPVDQPGSESPKSTLTSAKYYSPHALMHLKSKDW
jgi:hypothetical protein